MRERKTPDPGGRRVDLAGYVRRARERLVMKPNRSCGGVGITLGDVVPRARWERVLERALAKPDTWVVQERIHPHAICAPIADPRGHVPPIVLFVAVGLFLGPGGLGLLGRASRKPIVNVMQGGGLIAFVRGR